MRSMRQRLAAVTLIGGLTTLGLGIMAGPASAAISTECLGIIGGAQSGSLHLTSTPAAGSDVLAGSSINVAGAWNADDYEETDRFYVCGTVNGNYSDALSSMEKPLDNDGSFSAAVAVPGDLPVGSDVCFIGDVRGRLISGETGVDMVSESLCFRTAAAEPTTTTTTTTVAPIVEPAVIEAGTPSAPAVEVAPAPVEAPAPMPELPRTGTGSDVLAGFGAIALALGGAARFLGRRRPAEG